MKIGISAEWIGTQAGGPETYDANLVSAIAELDAENQYHIYTGRRDALKTLCDSHANFTSRYIGSSRWISISLNLPLELLRRPVDLFHATMVAPPFCPVRFVMTVHDLGFKVIPQYFPPLVRYRLSRLVSMGIKRAVKIISVSEATKGDLIRHYGIDERKVAVVHEGVSGRFRRLAAGGEPVRQALLKYGIEDDYILYVGRLHTRKNLARLVRAFNLIRKDVGGLKLLLVGRAHYYTSRILRVIEELHLQQDVLCLGHVDDEDLPALYNGARLFVYPSLFEGFGLPPLEAMACGTPVVASRCSSLPEVLGDAAALVDPYSVEDIAEKIRLLLLDARYSRDLAERGLARARRFSWRNTAEETLKVYREVLS